MNKEQDRLALLYADQWKNFVCSHKKIDKLSADYIVRKSYDLMGYQAPKICFADNTKTAIHDILMQNNYTIQLDIKYRFSHEIWSHISSQLSQESINRIKNNNGDLYQFCIKYKIRLFTESFNQIITPLNHRQKTVFTRLRVNTLLEKWAIYGSQSDFCISVLNCDYNPEKWEVFKSLMSCCGLIFCLPSEDIDFKETVVIVLSS